MDDVPVPNHSIFASYPPVDYKTVFLLVPSSMHSFHRALELHGCSLEIRREQRISRGIIGHKFNARAACWLSKDKPLNCEIWLMMLNLISSHQFGSDSAGRPFPAWRHGSCALPPRQTSSANNTRLNSLACHHSAIDSRFIILCVCGGCFPGCRFYDVVRTWIT